MSAVSAAAYMQCSAPRQRLISRLSRVVGTRCQKDAKFHPETRTRTARELYRVTMVCCFVLTVPRAVCYQQNCARASV